MNHRFQFPDVIALVGKGPLGDDASAVQLGVDVMDRHAEDLDASSMACAPRKAGSSEGWMLMIRPP